MPQLGEKLWPFLAEGIRRVKMVQHHFSKPNPNMNRPLTLSAAHWAKIGIKNDT